MSPGSSLLLRAPAAAILVPSVTGIPSFRLSFHTPPTFSSLQRRGIPAWTLPSLLSIPATAPASTPAASSDASALAFPSASAAASACASASTSAPPTISPAIPPAPPSMGKCVRVDVTSDTVCPWCFVGKKNLEAAIKQLGNDVSVEVVWHPYQLNPHAPMEGVEKEAMYREKFGARVPAMTQRMAQIFSSFGHQYSLGGLTGNTLDSHRLLWYARHGPHGSAERQNLLAEELFLDYFTREKFLGDRGVLVAAADRVGLEGAREFLEDPEAGKKEVYEEMGEFGQGVTGVPFFRIGGQTLSGAQPPETFLEALLRA